MKTKIATVLKVLILINLTYKISTTTINCSFDNLNIPIGHFNSIQSHGCDIQGLTLDEPQTPIKFSGTHDYDKTDDDVKIIKYQIYDEYQLPQFDASFCDKFPNIETIFISQLEILSVNENSLQNCQKLSKLYFYGNKIRELPENLLAENSNLTVLNVDFNFLTELPENFLKNQKNLEELSLTNNQLSNISSNFFNSLSNLNILGLGSNKISAIDPKLLKNLSNLVILGLERNEIIEISSNTFSSVPYLVELNLSNNKIKKLTSNSFNGLRGLKALNLDHNKIEELPENLFLNNEKLEELSIGHNKLTIIHSASFGYLPKFTTLHCHFNEIDGIDEKLIDNTAVFDLDLTENSCSYKWILNRNRLKTDLTQCFENYISMGYGPLDETSDDVEVTTSLAHSTKTSPLFPTPSSLITTEPTNIHNFDIRTNIEKNDILKEPSCGKPKLGLQTIMRGTAVVKGSYPWNAAILKTNGTLFCGGTVVSTLRIVTAAHCFKGKHKSHEFTAADIQVTVGAHNLSLSHEIGKQTIAVRKIISHPDWNPKISSFDADIALLELDEIITFSGYVQPICLISPGSDMEYITKGIVAGFGKSEFNEYEQVARFVDTPIHSYQNCLQSQAHQSLLSHRMFCGGHANGSGVCVGDSGSGLHVVYKNTFYLRGIVSASLHGSTYGCNVDAYAVFTDAMKHIHFIINGIAQ